MSYHLCYNSKKVSTLLKKLGVKAYHTEKQLVKRKNARFCCLAEKTPAMYAGVSRL
jgi:hypothetical protein